MNAQHKCAGQPVASTPGMARQSGLTLVELMIAIVLGLLVVLAATALLLSTKMTYTQQDESTRLEESGRYGLEVITRALRQTAYENWDKDGTVIVAGASSSANIRGLDANNVGEKTDGIDSPLNVSVHKSDVLAVRFFGSGASADGTVLNCAGFGIAAPTTTEGADAQRGWSIFHVTVNGVGEPELRCKYKGNKDWESEAIATGVESFQVLYGIDTDGDGIPNTYLNATGVDNLGVASWKKVAAVKIALLVRAASLDGAASSIAHYDLFGEEYGENFDDNDPGARIEVTEFSNVTRNRLRKVFTQTIQLRNKAAGGGA